MCNTRVKMTAELPIKLHDQMNAAIIQISNDNCTKSDISVSASDTLVALILNKFKMLKRIYIPLFHCNHTKRINSTFIRISTFFRILILWHIIGICLCAGKSCFYFVFFFCVTCIYILYTL